MPSAGFEPVILATKRPQTYTLDLADTEIGTLTFSISEERERERERERKSIFFVRRFPGYAHSSFW
jgi:hypothetical protein